ncbi:MAG: ABC transporter ATP-binding protein [Limnochordales bacterium]|nr:ABC transporter ATP-binding protein [Limnochordales bacterium]
MEANGEIRYDGVDLRDYDDRSVYQRASAVFQDYVKYHLTLRENIGFGGVGEIHDDGRIMQAIEEVELANVVAKVPQGLDSQLGREFGGAELSGGEWQKVAIARDIINKGDVVVLDEPTASPATLLPSWATCRAHTPRSAWSSVPTSNSRE